MNITAIASILQLILGLAPTVVDLMVKVEQLAPQSGSGDTKKSAVLSAVTAATNAAVVVSAQAPAVAEDVQAIKTGIDQKSAEAVAIGVGHMIDGLAGAFNKLGIFSKSSFVQNAGQNAAATQVPNPSVVATTAAQNLETDNTQQGPGAQG